MSAQRDTESIYLFLKDELSSQENDEISERIQAEPKFKKEVEAVQSLIAIENAVVNRTVPECAGIETHVMRKVSLIAQGLSAEGRYGEVSSFRNMLTASREWILELWTRPALYSAGAAFPLIVFLFLFPGVSLPPYFSKSHVQSTEVLMPLENISTGQELQPGLFKRVAIPSQRVDESMVTDFEELKSRFAKSMIVANEPLNRAYISSVLPESEVSALVPAGFRAVTIQVEATSDVEEWAWPGTKTDVVWSGIVDNSPTVVLLVENIKILSARRIVDTSNPGTTKLITSVTLLANEKEATRLSLAQQRTGALGLQLRGPNDEELFNAPQATGAKANKFQ